MARIPPIMMDVHVSVEPPAWNDHNSHGDYYGPPPEPPKPKEKLAAVLLGAAASAMGLKKPVSRRSLLFPWRKR